MFMSQTRTSYETPSTIVFDRKFDTAIRDSTITAFNNRLKDNQLTQDDLCITTHPEFIDQKPVTSDVALYAKMLKKILASTYENIHYTARNKTITNLIKPIITENLTVQTSYLLKSTTDEMTRKSLQMFEKWICNANLPVVTENLIHIQRLMSMMIENSNIMHKYGSARKSDEYIELVQKVNHSTLLKSTLGIEVIWSHQLVYFKWDDEHCIMPKPYLLMIHNKLSDLLSVLVMSTYAQGTQLPIYGVCHTIEFVQELCDLAIEYKEKFFTITKVLESLVMGEILCKTENFHNRSFLDTVVTELYDATGFLYFGSELERYLVSAEVPFMNELGCLSKLIGHPLVSVKGGAASVHKKTNEVYDLSIRHILECECYIKDAYIKRHIAREHKWPPCIIDGIFAPKGLMMANLRGVNYDSLEIVSKYGKTSIEDLRFVELLPNMRFNKLENVIPYLKDKTISILRSNVISKYITRDRNVSSSWKETRLLLFYLLHSKFEINHVDYINKYCISGDLEELIDYLVIRLVPKEKEHKIDARMFGCKTYEDRLRALAQEKSVMEYLDLYCDEQAMTLSELSLMRKLEGFRNLKDAFPGHLILYVNLDASAWNNHFRAETVDDIMVNTLDKIFDVNMFSKTHKAYLKTLVYVPDIEGTYAWEGQAGGIEGLNQDTWVVTYIAQIKTALSDLEFKYQILCKGDDLRVAIAIPEYQLVDKSVQQYKDEIVKKISDTAAKLGHTIKVNDSYASSAVFSFSKSTSVNKIELPQTFRKIQKCYGANNAFLPSIDEYIASSFSNAHSACKTSVNVFPAYATALFWSLFYLINDPNYSLMPPRDLGALLLVPSLAGGFPIIYLHNMFVRAESDLFSPFIGLYQHCTQINPIYANVMAKFMKYEKKFVQDFETLYRDNYSIPISRPPLPASVLRKLISPALQRIANNEDFLELISVTSETLSKQCLQIMASANILQVKILSGIYEVLPVGILSSLIRQFESARSIHELLILGSVGNRKSVNSDLRKVVRAEKKVTQWRIKVMKGTLESFDVSYVHLLEPCPAESAQIIRNLAWGKEISGITMPPLQHQILVGRQADFINHSWAMKNHFVIEIKPRVTTLDRDTRDHFKIGCEPPFLGKITSSKTGQPELYTVEKDIILSKLKKLINLVSWSSPSYINPQTGVIETSNVISLVEKIVSLYTNMTVDELSPFARQRVSGTVQHHVRGGGYREGIVPNVLTNSYRSCSSTTSTHHTLNDQTKHYRMNLLHMLCFSIALLNLDLEFESRLSSKGSYWIVTTPCSFCSMEIIERPMIFAQTSFHSLVVNPLSFTRLDDRAKTILKQSLALQKQEHKLNVYRELPTIEIAISGLINDFILSERHATAAIHAKYGSHKMSDLGRQALKTLSDTGSNCYVDQYVVSAIDVNFLIHPVSHIVSLQILTMLKSLKFRNLSLVLREVPPQSLPWYPLVRLLQQSGKLYPLILKYCTGGFIHPSMNFHTADTCSAEFGYACFEFWSRQQYHQNNLTIMSNYNTTYARSQIMRYSVGMLWRHCTDLIKTSQINSFMTDIAVHQALVISWYDWMNPDLFNHDFVVTSDRDEYKLSEFFELDLEVFDEDCLSRDSEMYLNPTNFFRYVLFKLEMKKSKAIEILKKDTRNIGPILQAFMDKTITINSVTLAECLAVSKNIGDTTPMFPPATIMENVYLTPIIRPPILSEVFTQLPRSSSSSILSTNHTFAPIKRLELAQYNRHHLTRTIGHGNCSASILGLIYQGLNMVPRSYSNITVVCLADGLGSFLSLTDKYCTNSTLVYNTLPDVKGVSKRPLEAMRYNSGNFIHTSHFDRGVYDLHDPSTLEMIRCDFPIVHIITCDIDLRDQNIDYISRVYNNILSFTTNTITPSGLVVCKIDLSHPDIMCKFIEGLNHIFDNVLLYRPPTHQSCRLSYVIGYSKKEGVFHPQDRLPEVSFSTVSCLNAFINTHKKVPEYDDKDPLPLVPAIRLKPNIVKLYPALWPSLLTQRVGVIVTDEMKYKIDNLFSSTVHNKWSQLAKIPTILDLDDYLNQLKKSLNVNEVVKHQTFDLNKQKIRISILRRWFRGKGLLLFLGYFENVEDQVIVGKRHNINIHLFRCDFCRLLQTLEYRDTHPDMENASKLYAKTMRIGVDESIDISYWSDFLSGVSIGQSIIGVVHSRFPLTNKKTQRHQ